ncbi:MAG: segregation/condensation protein A [Oscillospiraceae bacterium]|nr:segregation/condensation protein A [Oscillospiraceae bacterium]MDD4413880.1 segregation/condensation protein A [Oscillospiraceae bacterium]
METISYKIPGFEGPLDLLLYLVQKHKLNIMDIPIAELLEQYMKTIEEWKSINLEVAAEFLEMAARLVYIKSAMLLPRHDEADEMRRELSGELMEYRHCQEAAGRLAEQNIGGNLFVRDPAEIELDLTYRRIHPKESILDAYLAAAGRGRRRLPPPAKAFSNIVSRKIVSVSSKIIFVLRHLYKKNKIRYKELFNQADSRSELVAIFLALLELIKANRIRVDGEGDNQLVSMKSGQSKSNIKA